MIAVGDEGVGDGTGTIGGAGAGVIYYRVLPRLGSPTLRLSQGNLVKIVSIESTMLVGISS